MNRMEQLIEELCPEGVEVKELGEVMSITRGASPRPIQNFITTKQDGIPWIKIGDVNPKSKFIIQTKEKITKEGAEKSRYLKKGDFVLSNSMSFGRPYILAIDGCIHDGWISMQNFESVLISDFLYYLLGSDFVQNYWKQKASSGTVQNLNADIIRSTKIPFPPLPIQQKIVKILDTFTALDAELQAELEARRKQYEHYRNELLNFEGKEVEWKTLGECLQRTKGTAITAQQMSVINKEGAPIKIFAGGKTVAYVDYGDIPEKDVLTRKSIVVKSRGIIEFEYIDKPFSHKNEFWSYNSNNLNINIKYVYYFLKNKEPYFQSVGQRMSKMPQLSIPDTDKYSIPIPPLAEQERIVGILDKFEALVSSTGSDTGGLPAEIAARRKQYEYYREKLLTFKSLNN